MKNFLLGFALTAALLLLAFSAPASARLTQLTPDAVNDAGSIERPGPKSKRAALLRAQVLLDRAHFSPGEIDASPGSNLKKAITAFQKHNELHPSGTIDKQTWMVLNQDGAPVLVEYTITAADVTGPFAEIPKDILEKSRLPAMGFTSPAEALGEKFHISPKLLRQLNPRKNLGGEGEAIIVPNVEATTPLPKGAKLIVNKNASTVTLLDASGKTLAHYPASVGSKHDPLPLGNWKVLGVARNPSFHYNPKLFWDADPGEKSTKIPPGPNNPVGVVWIDLSKPHYGIHGTPEPSTIGKTQSHGCIRLTNWDAAALAQAVSPGMPAILQE
jgi:lipoprotein-anchoring transpeptidase ErfK/SrfK